MIDWIMGAVHSVYPEENVVVVRMQGVGVRVEVPSSLARRTHQRLTAEGPYTETLYTVLVATGTTGTMNLVPKLYGFSNSRARDLFTLLRSVPGIGSKAALRIMGARPTTATAKAIAEGDPDSLRVKGVGPKKCSQIISSLREKVPVEWIE